MQQSSLTVFCILLNCFCYCQASTSYQKTVHFGDKLFKSIDRKAEKMEGSLNRSTRKYLDKLCRHELKMQEALAKKDSLAAQRIFGNVRNRYDSLNQILTHSPDGLQTSYDGHLDSVTAALHFLQGNASPAVNEKMKTALKSCSDLQGKLNQTEFIQTQIRDRETYLKNSLQSTSLAKEFTKYKKEAYYYRAQISEYRNILDDPKKMETTLLSIANKFASFQKFFAKYSFLGGLFRLPGAEEDNTTGIAGLQTRSMVTQNLQQQLGSTASVQGFMNNSINGAQNALQQVRNRVNQSGSSSDAAIPDFKPNPQKSKTFLKRIEIGTNIQSVKSNFFFPSTTDIGLSVGYRLSTKAVAGVGASYKMGWGKDYRHIAITHQGAGLRSFADFRLKGNIWISGGGELNYRSSFKDFAQLKNAQRWQTSALAGLSKKYQVGSKMKGSMQVLYDFLHAQQRPAGQPVVFRMGYNLK